MKLKDLFEMPEYRDLVRDQSDWIEMKDDGSPGKYISVNTVQRVYDEIDEIKIHGIKYRLLLNKKKMLAGAFIPGKIEQTGEAVYWVASIIYFKSPMIKNLPVEFVNNILQVDRVATIKKVEGFDLASTLYSCLARKGFTVVSDNIQYTGGKKLWQKLARKSKISDVKVYVFDTQISDVFRDVNDQPLEYNEDNIDDDKIWKKGKPGRRFLLIASI